jgi:superfamily II DNA or RNA helicase
MKFITLDPVTSKAIDDEARNFISTILFCEANWYKQGRFGGSYKTYKKKFYQKNGQFLTGFTSKIYAALRAKQFIGFTWEYPAHRLFKEIQTEPFPKVKGIEFREDQERLINDVKEIKIGVLKAPARTGKTVVAAGIFSLFPQSNCLFLMHTKDLLYQTYEEMQRFGYDDIGIVGDGKKDWKHKITIALHQSFTKLNPKEYCDYFDVVIVDECHHVSSLDGNYAKILRNLAAHYRIGLTATPSPDPYKNMCMEGMLGPIIGEVTMEEAQLLGLQAQPKVKIIRVPPNNTIKNLKTYWEAYMLGVVRNRARNRLIVKTAQEYLDKDMTVLILVKRVQHGMILEDMFDLLSEYKTPFLCGGLDSDTSQQIKLLEKKVAGISSKADKLLIEWTKVLEDFKHLKQQISDRSKRRNEYRHLINDRKVKCIIVTNIWNEGINIPTLNVVINAAGGKSETATIQSASRSLTGHKDKKEGIIIDFFDNNSRYFVDHFGERFVLYCEMGWV